jgi:integrase
MVGRQDITVEWVMRDLLDHPPAAWRAHTTLMVRRHVGERIISILGARRLAQLTVRDVETMLGKLAAEGLSHGYMLQIRTVLCQAVDRAVRDEVIGRNVARLAKVPDGPCRQSRAMTAVQVDKLLALDLTPWWRAYILTAVTIGLRPGEMVGLRWEDVDLDAGTVLRVRTSLKRVAVDEKRLSELRARRGRWGNRDETTVKSMMKVSTLKNEHSKRTHRMPAITREALTALREAQEADKRRIAAERNGGGEAGTKRCGRCREYKTLEQFWRDHNRRDGRFPTCRTCNGAPPPRRPAPYADSGLVFADDGGHPTWPEEARRGFRRLCEQAGIGMWQVRELRHTYVSHLSHEGVPLERIADAVGHKNSRVTAEVYRHSLADVITETGDVMDRIYGSGQ